MEKEIVSVTSVDDCFVTDILRDLILQGYNGDNLIEKFSEQYRNIRKAVNQLHCEADEIVAGTRISATTEEIFGEV